MSLWSKIIGFWASGQNSQEDVQGHVAPPRRDVGKYAFVDAEVSMKTHKVCDIGALRHDGAVMHGNSLSELQTFLEHVDFVCGHNIVHHDATYIFSGQSESTWKLVDTLYVSPLLFPKRPYHKLAKDDKLFTDQLNNPVNDCEKARELLFDEMASWRHLTAGCQTIYATLLQGKDEFEGFLQMVGAKSLALYSNEKAMDYGLPAVDHDALSVLVHEEFAGLICEHADIRLLAERWPCALAYTLALVGTDDPHSVMPPWVQHHFPEVYEVMEELCHVPCAEGCEYCRRRLDVHQNLKRFFGYEQFRTYDDEPLQEKAVRAAVNGHSLLAVFPTGGGKSLTFQLPALMDGRSVHGLTVVISPLQSLMKDQVDNLAHRGITDAVTINGLLDPISRSLSIERVLQGDASLLYISPEMLRSKTVEKILLARHVVRFVIDEAHCFSAWGQDFRVDYLYIGKFIKWYEKQKNCAKMPVSCFTATAKQEVIRDICEYFKQWLGTDMELYTSSASRKNLHYKVIHVGTDDEKYNLLREIIGEYEGAAIVYVSRTKRTKELADKLNHDGISALPYNGKMDADAKVRHQEAYMADRVRVIVATSAFGMGVDKSDVKLVVHYDISDSLENYIQEAGRAGRDPRLNASCYVLYADDDLDKHFILLNQTKLSINEIQQVWKAVKDFTKVRPRVCCSALEIARQAGWDNTVTDIETRVRTALSALEQAGYIERGNNVPHVYATGITVKNMDEARRRLTESSLFSDDEVETSVRIIRSLISQKSRSKGLDSEAESRVDYLADILGMGKRDVVSAVERMRQDGILADSRDISAYLQDTSGNERHSLQTLEQFGRLEQYILSHIPDESLRTSYKQLNENAVREGIVSSNEKNIRTLFYFLTVKGYARKNDDMAHGMILTRRADMAATIRRFERRVEICRFTIGWLYRIATETQDREHQDGAICFSVIELLNAVKTQAGTLFHDFSDMQIEDVEEALLYLSKIGALKLEGGFLVLYNAMDIYRRKDSRFRYKQEDYRMLRDFYCRKVQQIHIVGEYADLMVHDPDVALQYVQDYFHMEAGKFISKYFKGERTAELNRNITSAKYKQLFGHLSPRQKDIIDDHESRCIVVAAGPGSGKTRVLVHKLASLLLLEDVKHEQLLMLTFSRAAATEFKQRLVELIGNAAHFVEIKTFHSYSFELLGRVGSLEGLSGVEARAAEMIRQHEVEPSRIGKAVLVIDEAQDMSHDDHALVSALMSVNEDLRVIAVGDDDQNIFGFRGADSTYMYRLSTVTGARLVEMTENYRSSRSVVLAANSFVAGLSRRIKTSPIVSMTGEYGQVTLVRHRSRHMYQPLAEDVCHRGEGTTCVLTQTNEEAVIVLALLHRRGVSAKLIQSLDGFRFCNLAEMRYFMKCIDHGIGTPVIDDELWEEAKRKTYARYASSTSLPYVQRCVDTFESINRAKYYSDFRDFVLESSVEDFCALSGADVVVSTIHKAKGREFDHVYMLASAQYRPADDVLRRLYVAMTRARSTLSIHTDGDVFAHMCADQRFVDSNLYSLPEEVILQLSHRDVNLGFFKECKQHVLALRGGDALNYKDRYLYSATDGHVVGMLSQAMLAKLSKWESESYKVVSATVRFVMAWKPKGASPEDAESAVLLADLLLRRKP